MRLDEPCARHAVPDRRPFRAALGAPRRTVWTPSRIVLVVIAIFLYPRPAYAYLDPGTGSALVYVISGVVVSALFLARSLYDRTIELVLRGRFKAPKRDVVIHSEDRRYETTFLPIIRALARRKIEFSYITMYERDALCKPLPPEATHQVIPPGLVGYSYLNHLEAKLLLTTTPQLDVMMFRRSKRVKHYCMVQHALGESRFVRPYAYDFFDSVMCCGPILEENIRKIESIRGMPTKRLLRTGIPHYGELVGQVRPSTEVAERKTVLVAPSWGPMSLFQVFGTGFVRRLVDRYRVIVRPHPQMKVSQTALYEEILAIEGADIDTGPTPAGAISRADIVVSDISGIAYEFAFIHEKPVIVIDHKIGVDALEGHLLRDVTTLQERCGDFIVALPPSEMDTLPERIEDVLGRDVGTRIVEARSELIYGFTDAGETAASQIEEIVACL